MKQDRLFSRVAAKAIRSTITPVLIVLVLSVMATTFVSYRVAIDQLQERVDSLAIEHRSDIETFLWEFDLDAVVSHLRGFTEQQSVQRAFIVDQSGQLISEGTAPDSAKGLIKTTMVLKHLDGRGGVETLGQLTIEANNRAVWNLAIRNALALIAVFVVSTVFVTLLIIHRFNQIFLAPLSRLSGKLRSPDHISDERIRLSRESGGADKDELDELVDSIQSMRSHLLHAREGMEEGVHRLASAAHLAGLAFATFEPTLTRLVSCDDNYASILRKSTNELLEMHIIDDVASKMLDHETFERAMQTRARIVAGHSEILTIRLNFEDGEFLFLKQYFISQHDEHGQVVAIDVIAQDVTHEQINQEMLLQSQKNKAIGNLTGGVAHDFNNILAVISGNVEFAIASTENPVVICHNNTALEAVNRGARLTQKLLSFARKQPMSPVVVDAGKLVRESAPLIQTSVGATIDVEIITDAGLWRTVADQAQLEAVLLNLVVNARDAMPDGGSMSIECSNARLDDNYARSNMEVAAGNYVCLSVSDSGCGMSESVVKQCIEPFFTTKAVGDGTGLGLSMAFGFAKQSKGHLKIYSEEGHGTTVRLYLPKVQERVAPSVPALAVDHRAALRGLHVLVIEDNKQLRQVICNQVESLGCRVYSAYDEPSTLALIEGLEKVDVILSDIILPGNTDGRRLAELLTRQMPEAKTIFMSGFTENAIIHNGTIDEGVVFLQKPFRLRELAQAIANQMETVEECDV